MSYRRACLTGVYLAGVWLIGVRLKPPSHTGRHCVGWHAVVCYGAPEWFRLKLHLLRYHLPRHHHGYNEKMHKSKGEASVSVCLLWAIRRLASKALWAP
jgi:hypothetical protein